MKVHPVGDKILVKKDAREEKTPGGVIIPETADQKVTHGVVVAVGRGRITDQGKLIEPEVRVGEKVIFNQYAGQDVELDGQKLLVVRADDILCGEEP